MVKAKRSGSTRRFGSRYGRRTRQKFEDIETLQHASYKCPYCHFERVKRESIGIWSCSKCNAKFSGRAYTLPKKSTKVEVVQKTVTIKEVEE